MDDPRGAELLAIAEARGLGTLTVGRDADADIRLLGQRFDAAGQVLRFAYDGVTYQQNLPLIGGFQAENVLVAYGLVLACGADPAETAAQLHRLDGVRGRMQLAGTRANGATVFVDYAHTPDALAVALQALRPHVMGRLVVVFGAGGRPRPRQTSADGGQRRQNMPMLYL